MFWVRFIRPSVDGAAHEVVCTGDMDERAIPRQGDWVRLRLTPDLTVHSMVEKVTVHYRKDSNMLEGKVFRIDHYEIILA